MPSASWAPACMPRLLPPIEGAYRGLVLQIESFASLGIVMSRGNWTRAVETLKFPHMSTLASEPKSAIASVSLTESLADPEGFSQKLGGSFERYGFAVIADHGIPADL